MATTGYLQNTDAPQDKSPIEVQPKTDLWNWFLSTYDRKYNANKYMVNADGTTISYKNQPVLILPSENGSITEGSILLESEYKTRIRAMSRQDRKKLQEDLKKAGYLAPDYIANGLLDTNEAFLDAAMNLARTVSSENYAIAQDPDALKAGRKPVSTDDYIALMSKSQSGYSRVSTQKSITSFSDADSRGLLESFYGDALGRRPTDLEVSKFKKAINLAAKSNPDVTTTVAGTLGSSSTSKNGYSAADAQLSARKMAESEVGAAGYTSSTKYMDTFMKVLNQGRSEF